jgi:hypothetical protein
MKDTSDAGENDYSNDDLDELARDSNIVAIRHLSIIFTRYAKGKNLADSITLHFSEGDMDIVFALGLLELAKDQIMSLSFSGPAGPTIFSRTSYEALCMGPTTNDEEGEEEEEILEGEAGDRDLEAALQVILDRAIDSSSPRERRLILDMMNNHPDQIEASVVSRLLGRKTKVLISGSRSIKTLPEEAKRAIDTLMYEGCSLLVGDAPGVDSLVQEYVEACGYEDLLVYYALFNGGGRPRNTHGFPHKGVPGNYRDRDAFMCRIAGRGLAIWDGKSRGTVENIRRVERTTIIRV